MTDSKPKPWERLNISRSHYYGIKSGVIEPSNRVALRFLRIYKCKVGIFDGLSQETVDELATKIEMQSNATRSA